MLRVWGFGIMQRLQRLSFLQQRRPGVQDFMTFSQQFAAMLAAGIPVLTGLEILGEQTESRWLRNGIKAAARRVEQGNTLTEALQQEGKLFSPFFLGMIEAGEAAGILDQTMQRLALHFKNRHDLEQKIRTATIYPKFVFLFILGVAAFLLTFIVPAFADTFQGMGAKIPLPTRLLIVMGKGLRTYWYLLFLAGIVFYLLYLRVAKTKKGVFYLDWLRLRLPLFGHLYYKMMLAQFCQIFSAMLGSGVDILRALDLLKNVVNNSVFHERIQGIKKSIIKGGGIAETLAAAGIFPRLVVGMASVGEQSGRLEEMLEKAAILYESEVGHTAERLGALIEPALIFFLALLVGGIMLSVFLPLFNIFSLYL